MTLPELITLQAGTLRLRVCPHVGGAVVDFFRGEQPVFRPLAPGALEQRASRLLACFPLLPYSNRIAEGRFTWDGRAYQLDRNFPDHPHTIHGVGWQQPWRVEEHSQATGTDRLRLALDYDPDEAGLYTWPFRLHAGLDYALDPDGLHITLSVRNTDATAWPAGLGVHPYYPHTPDVRIGFHARDIWTRTPDSLPVRPEPIPPEWQFDPPRPPDGPMLDNCYVGWDSRARLDFPSLGHAVAVETDPLFDHLLVFTPDNLPDLALEPVSHLPDAINRMAEVPDGGLRLLQPGDTLSGTVRFTVTATGESP